MKKRIIISLLCGLVICCIAVYSFATTGIVSTDTLRLRKSNSTDSSIITLLSIDEKVEILERTENGWYKVKYIDSKTNNTYEGYVSGDYIKVNEEIKTPPANPSEDNKTSDEENKKQPEEDKNIPSEEEGTKENVEESTTKMINKGEKIYKIPLINSNTISILENDVTVKIATELNGWSYVTSENLEGWIRTEKLKDTGAKNKIGYINTNSVNFREKPDLSGKVISALSKNAEVEIIEENNGWIKIKYKDNVGYVGTKYVSDSKIQTTSRSAASRKAKTPTKTTKTATKETEIATTETLPAKAEAVSANANASEIVSYAKKYLGYRYIHGGNSPSGFDCSGFTQYVYKHFGYSLSRSSSSQARNGVGVSKGNLQPGDIICFSGSKGSKKISHAGIYIGGGKFIHAANSRKGVIISNVDGDGYFYVCARRIIN